MPIEPLKGYSVRFRKRVFVCSPLKALIIPFAIIDGRSSFSLRFPKSLFAIVAP
jgi:hypothetical protein